MAKITVKERINDRQSKPLILRANNETLYNSKHHSYDRLKKYLDCNVINEKETDTILGLHIELIEKEF